MRSLDDVRSDFDEIAQLVEPGASGVDLFDHFLLSLVPERAVRVLDVGCGLGRLTWAIAAREREVVGVDLSPRMLERAKMSGQSPQVSFHHGDFVTSDFDGRRFDCIVSAAALHHMEQPAAVVRMIAMLTPGGRLIIHDLRRNDGIVESLRAWVALAGHVMTSLARTGRALPPRRVRKVWARHGARETYLSLTEARALAVQNLPGAAVYSHALWRYTIVWDKPLLT
jgi:2-polyprenyl-3-methyl-5-hydroxy-6-metoxy-1,4-benzoquinol methylase